MFYAFINEIVDVRKVIFFAYVTHIISCICIIFLGSNK